MIKKLLSLVIFLALVNAGARLAVAFFHDQQFNDAVREIALFGAKDPDEALKQKVMDAARRNAIPLEPEFIEISRRSVVVPNDKVVIKVAYAEMIQLAPGYARRFDFEYTTP
ncbi:MAG TPA: hypothetical protein VFK57_11895 [Vicinamibacterales bacterium]|nr:hypothetical protein [Vicinamibacterales bacterium]